MYVIVIEHKLTSIRSISNYCKVNGNLIALAKFWWNDIRDSILYLHYDFIHLHPTCSGHQVANKYTSRFK